jgi:hypothetical protein
MEKQVREFKSLFLRQFQDKETIRKERRSKKDKK